MFAQEYLDRTKKIYKIFINYIDSIDQSDDLFEKLITLCDIKNKAEIRDILHIIDNTSKNRYIPLKHFEKIYRILIYFKAYIKNQFSNYDIFNIFKRNKKILLFLIKNDILVIDYSISKIINNIKYSSYLYPDFFYPELSGNKVENMEEFERKREIGENDNDLCRIIRNDLIDEFILYIEQNKLSLSSTIKKSIFETNHFLLKNKPNLIQYAAFCGSFQIFQFLFKQKIGINQDLWIYIVHSQNANFIDLFINSEIIIDEELYKKYLIQSICFHNNDIENFLENNISSKYILNNTDRMEIYSKRLKYYNFNFFPTIFNDIRLFHLICKYDYATLFIILSKAINIDINHIFEVEINKTYGDILKSEKSLFHIAVEKGNLEIIQFLLSQNKININQKMKNIHHYYYKEEIFEKTALHIAIEKENLEVLSILLANNDIDINSKLIYKYKKRQYEEYCEKSALYIAIEKENVEIVKCLLTREDIDINIKCISKEDARTKCYTEKTPLSLAVERGNNEILSLLLNKKIDINEINNKSYSSSFGNYVTEQTTALHIAVLKNNQQIINQLLSYQNIDVNLHYIYQYKIFDSEKSSSRTALHMAIKNENDEIVMILLQNPNIDVNMKSVFVVYEIDKEYFCIDEKITQICPLHFAIENKSYEIIQLLLEKANIEVNIKYSYSECDYWADYCKRLIQEKTALHIAIENDEYKLVQLLLSHIDINPNIRSLYKESEDDDDYKIDNEQIKEYTPLNLAVSEKQIDIVELLLADQNVNINLNSFSISVKTENETICEIEYLPNIVEASYFSNDEILLLLLSHPDIDVNNKEITSNYEVFPTSYGYSIDKDNLLNYDEYSLLCYAVTSNDYSLVYLLLQNPNIDVNIKNLHWQSFSSDYEENLPRYYEENSLLGAVMRDNIQIAELLLKHPKINPNDKIYEYKYQESDHCESKENTPLNVAIKRLNIQMVKLFLENPKTDINIKKRKYYENKNKGLSGQIEKSPLYIATEKKFVDMVQLLLENSNLDINSKSIVKGNIKKKFIYIEETTLHFAVSNNMNEIVQLLLLHPTIDVNVKAIKIEDDKHKENNALHFAVKENNIDIVKYLLSNKNMDINAKNLCKKGNVIYEKTPLHIAVEKGSIDMIITLLNYDHINVNSKNEKGQTPIEITSNDTIKALLCRTYS